MTLSPRLPTGLARDVAESGPTSAELDQVTELALRRGARSLAIGRGRSVAAAAAVTGLARRWEAGGGTVLTVVTWPEEAASWLRQAARLAAADPDLWVMAGSPHGWAQVTRRLLWSTSWQPGRTLAFAALGTQRAIELVGAHNLQGLAGATADGGTWTICNGSLRLASSDKGTAASVADHGASWRPGVLGCHLLEFPLIRSRMGVPRSGGTGRLGGWRQAGPPAPGRHS